MARENVVVRYRRKKKYPVDSKCYCNYGEESVLEDESDPNVTPTTISTSTIKIPQICETIESTSTTWSTCNVDHVDADGKVSCTQTPTVNTIK